MVIYMLGWHWEHPAPFAIERPNGLHGTQLLVVRSKGRIVMGEQEYHVTPNTAFLVSSCMPHCLYSEDGDYCDDWIRFSVEQEDYALIEKYSVPKSKKRRGRGKAKKRENAVGTQKKGKAKEESGDEV